MYCSPTSLTFKDQGYGIKASSGFVGGKECVESHLAIGELDNGQAEPVFGKLKVHAVGIRDVDGFVHRCQTLPPDVLGFHEWVVVRDVETQRHRFPFNAGHG